VKAPVLLVSATIALGLAPSGFFSSGFLTGGFVTGAFAEDAKPPAAAPLPDSLKSDEAQAGYGIGFAIGRQIKKDGAAIDAQALLHGLQDALSGAASQLTDDQLRDALGRVEAAAQARRQAQALAAAEANAAQGAAFLKANAARPGVVSLPSGLQYQVLKPGTGPVPKAGDTVTCNYRGTLIDGAEFDSSYKRGEPASFVVGGVIKGWTEALQLMPVGSKWKLFVPPALAYGEKGAGADIAPNSTLIFEVELLSVQPGG
jgi:FKBP-type peptidyl-prolyl cis-trans isomerase FklB